jgi:hypothetical protein
MAMAVRDEQQHQHNAIEAEWLKQALRKALDHLPGLIVASGLLLYGYLSLNYYSFYSHLGVDPNDVGLSYTGTLARSSGFVLVYFLPALTLLVPPTRWRRGSKWLRRAQWAAWLAAITILGVVIGSIHGTTSAAVRHVEAGAPVRPVEAQLPLMRMTLVFLAIHADPAYVEPAGKAGDFPGFERLRQKNLLYLGQSNGTVVLYDPALQEAIYVPASSIVLHVINCREDPEDPPCWPWPAARPRR